MKIASLVVISLLMISSLAYLEIHLLRYHQKDELYHKGDPVCITKADDEELDKKKHSKEKTKHKKSTDDDEDSEDEEESFDDEDVDDNQNYKEICY